MAKSDSTIYTLLLYIKQVAWQWGRGTGNDGKAFLWLTRARYISLPINSLSFDFCTWVNKQPVVVGFMRVYIHDYDVVRMIFRSHTIVTLRIFLVCVWTRPTIFLTCIQFALRKRLADILLLFHMYMYRQKSFQCYQIENHSACVDVELLCVRCCFFSLEKSVQWKKMTSNL